MLCDVELVWVVFAANCWEARRLERPSVEEGVLRLSHQTNFKPLMMKPQPRPHPRHDLSNSLDAIQHSSLGNKNAIDHQFELSSTSSHEADPSKSIAQTQSLPGWPPRANATHTTHTMVRIYITLQADIEKLTHQPGQFSQPAKAVYRSQKRRRGERGLEESSASAPPSSHPAAFPPFQFLLSLRHPFLLYPISCGGASPSRDDRAC